MWISMLKEANGKKQTNNVKYSLETKAKRDEEITRKRYRKVVEMSKNFHYIPCK